MPSSVSEYEPQVVSAGEAAGRRRRAWLVWGALAALTLGLVALLVVAPLSRAAGWLAVSQAVYLGFQAVCHQLPERSFHVAGFPLAVCARCFGLYAGGAAGVLAYPLVRAVTRRDAPARGWLFAAAAPTCVDFLLGVTGVWANTHLSRFLTALALGAAAAFYVVPALVDWGRRRSFGSAAAAGAGVAPAVRGV